MVHPRTISFSNWPILDDVGMLGFFQDFFRTPKQRHCRGFFNCAGGEKKEAGFMGPVELGSSADWWFGCHQFYFPIQLGIIIPTDVHIFQRG